MPASAASGRYDVDLTMPDHPVQRTLEGVCTGGLSLVRQATPSAALAPVGPDPRFVPGPALDLAPYGAAAAAPVPDADLSVTCARPP